MKVLNLRCSHDHRFEGWFASEEDYLAQDERGLLVCPICADQTIGRLPSAPHINVARSKSPASDHAERAAATGEGAGEAKSPAATEALSAGAITPIPSREMTMQSMWLQAVRHVIANTHDVGDRFAEEARRIHYGESEERAIRGQATRDEAEALRDEGIDVMAMPIPAGLKGPLQ